MTDHRKHSLIDLLRLAEQAARAGFFDLTKGELPVTLPQLLVLEVIVVRNSKSQWDVCLSTGIDRSTMSDLTGRLEKKN